MIFVRIDREMILEDMYKLRSMISVENDEARKKLSEIIGLITSAPTDEKKNQFPRINGRRCG